MPSGCLLFYLHHMSPSAHTLALASFFLAAAGGFVQLPAASLLQHWTLNEGTGGTMADSVGTADLSIVGSTSGWTTGKDGGAFLFNGSTYARSSSDAVSVPDSGEAAIAFWFRTAPDVGRADVMVDIEDLYTVRLINGQLQVTFTDSMGSMPRYGSDLDDGAWHHIVAQNNGSTTSMYIDGAFAGSHSESLRSLTTKSLQTSIGARRGGNNQFDGTIDDVRFYNGNLSLSEVEALAQLSDRPPTAYADSYTVALNTVFNVAAPGVLINDFELDGDSLTVSQVAPPSSGSLYLNTDGSFRFTPALDFNGVVTFSYEVQDKDGVSNPAVVTLTVLDPNTSLTPEEVRQIESGLGITLTGQEIVDLASVVKPQTLPAWRTDAETRIEAYRKADLTIEVVDSLGTPVTGANVSIELRKHDFKFGGVVTVMDLTDASGNLSGAGSTTDDWKRITKGLFNAVGLNNGFKPKIVSQHQYIPDFMSWASANDLDVRGHLLIWPGTGDIVDLDTPGSVPGVDYGNHLSNFRTSEYASYDVLGAVETYKASDRTQAKKDALEAVVDAEIEEWVSQWDVYEWDVINEPLSNRLLQEILGNDQVAEWFNLAEANKVSPSSKLFINEFQIASARFDTGSNSYEPRRDAYFSWIDQVISDGGAIDGIGFQSRFRFLNNYDPAVVYARIDDFATRYPGLEIVGTEFEIKDDYNFTTGILEQAYDEMTRAQVTEEILTTYFSHDQVTGMNVWDFINPLPDGTDNAYSRSLCYYGDGAGGVDGPVVKLNGLVWYYLHRIRYHTDSAGTTDAGGVFSLRGFKGDYDVTVSYGGNDYPASYHLLADGTLQVTLGDVLLSPTEATLDFWPFDDPQNTELQDAANTEGSTSFAGATPAGLTDGSGLFIIAQDAAKSTGGDYISSSGLTIGERDTGSYEMEFRIHSADLSTGGTSGATVGFKLRDAENASDVFYIRLSKTAGGLVISTFIDNTYIPIHSFSGQFSISTPVRVRVVVDLDADTADIYLREGAGAEQFKQQVSLSTNGTTWSGLGFVAVNNTAVWGATDTVEIDYFRVKKLNLDNYSRWVDRVNWSGSPLQSEVDNPDGDRMVNWLEYALGGDPVVDDGVALLPRVVTTGGAPQYEFTLGVDSVDLRYIVEHSSDLIDWDTLAPTVIHGQAGKTIQMPLVDMALEQRFSRLSVESLQP